MAGKVVPMMHVPDVRATVDWYQGIGVTVNETYGDDAGGLSFGILSFGSSQVMFNSGGQPSARRRREVDLYVYADDVDDLYRRLQDRVDVVEGPHDTFYGMREFIIRDLNRFWITFAQPSVFERLMSAVRDGNRERLRVVLESGELKPETLNAALAAASSRENSDQNTEIAEMLMNAGAVPPPQVDSDILRSYVGKYLGENGFEINISLRDGELLATTGGQPALSLVSVDQTTFRPIEFDNYGTLTFNVEGGKTISCALALGDGEMQLKRVDQ